MKRNQIIFIALSLLTLSSCVISSSDNKETSTVDNSSSDISYEMTLSTTSMNLFLNDSYKLEVTINPGNLKDENLSYESSNSNIASIDNEGIIRAKSYGEATIKVVSNTYKCENSCHITVINDETSDSSIDSSSSTSAEEHSELSSMQDAPILHCWNWSMTNVKNKLQEIKNAGFSAVQLSPMQPQKDYYSSDYWGNGWWKLYQPLGFSVATKNNAIGTKTELKELCKKAKELEIDVIMDVVSNHLAGGSATSLNSSVKEYESTIYSSNLIHTNGKCSNWDSPKELLTYAIGDYPDLKTESSVVQDRVVSLLKEYIDCGVNGFRFDAAKHIETPDDGTYASNYWPNVLKKATDYAQNKNLEAPYYYGELLNTIGTNRKFSSYSKYFSITDTRYSSTTLSGVKNKSLSSLKSSYPSGVSADKLVLWGESHDNYADKSTSGISQDIIDKTYIIEASRKDASILYLARPDSGTKLGEIGSENYKNKAIKAANEFHTRFSNNSENISTNNGCFINVRGNLGAVIVGISNSSSSLKLNISNLEKGTYVDLISNKEYEINDEEINISLTNDVSILVNKNKSESTLPEIKVGKYNEIFKDSQDFSVNVSNATEVTYKINNSSSISLTNNKISLGSDIKNGLINIDIEAKNDRGKSKLSLTLIKTTKLLDSSLIIYNFPADQRYSYLIWAWKDSENGSWFDLTMEDDIAGTSLNDKNNFIVVKFPFGTTSSSASWDNKIAQTSDIHLDKKIYSFDELGF